MKYTTSPAVKTDNPRLPPRDARCAVGGIRAWAEDSGRRASATIDGTPIAALVGGNLKYFVIAINREFGWGDAQAVEALGSLAAALASAAVTSPADSSQRYDAALLSASAALALGAAWLIPAGQHIRGRRRQLPRWVRRRAHSAQPTSYLLAREGATAVGARTAMTFGAIDLLLGVGGLGGPILARLA